MQQAVEQQPLPCQISPLNFSITSTEPCMLSPPRQEGNRPQRRWWQHDHFQQGSGEHSTGPAATAVVTKEAGRESNPVEAPATGTTTPQNTCVSVGAWVRAPPSAHLQGWDPAQESLEQCCNAARGTAGGQEPMLRVLACTSAGYVPTQGLLTQSWNSSGGGAGSSCGSSDRDLPHPLEQLSITRPDCSSADGTVLYKVTFQLPSNELAPHAARPRLLHLELWQGHLLLSSSVLLLLPPYLPSTAAELQRLPWGGEDKEDESLSFVTDLGIWLEENELMSRDQQPETSQDAHVCSEPWNTGSALLRQAVLWAMPALGELLLESLMTLPCAPLSPFAHLAHAKPPPCCSGSFASKRTQSQQHSPTFKPLLSSKHTAHSASAPSPSAGWRGAELEEAVLLQGPLSAQGSARKSIHNSRRSSGSVSSWSSHKERKDGLLHLALLSPEPIEMMMYLLFWGRRWGDLKGYVSNKSKVSLASQQNGGTNGAPACLLPPCGFVWRFDELNSDGLTPFDILGSLPCAPQMLRIMLDEPAEGFSLLKDAARLSELRSTSSDECPADFTATLMTVSRAKPGQHLPETHTSLAADGGRPHSPQPQEEIVFERTGIWEEDEESSSEDMDTLPAIPVTRRHPCNQRKSLSYDGVQRSKTGSGVSRVGVQDQKASLINSSHLATKLTSTQLLETFVRAGMMAGSNVVATAEHQLEGRLERHSAAGCVPA